MPSTTSEARLRGHGLVTVVAKPVPVLALAAWVLSTRRDRYARAVAIGLGLSAVGDVLLEFPARFVPGLVAFLCAHVAYTVAFVGDERRLRPARALPFAAWIAAAFVWLRPGLGDMAGPVVVYMLAIATMMWRAAARVDGGAGRASGRAALAGAVLFGLSDTLIAIERFHAPLPAAGRYAIMALYWAGQAGIAASAVLAARSGEAPRGTAPTRRPAAGPLALVLVTVVAALAAAGCRHRESLQESRDRALESLLVAQNHDLRQLITRAEAGGLVTRDRIAIGLSEDTVKALLDASLPQEHVVASHLHVRIDRAQPLFRGNDAVLVFHAAAWGDLTGARAEVELGGRLGDFRIDEGRLTAKIELLHFRVLDTSLGGAGARVLEALVHDNLGALSARLERVEIPVYLEQSIAIGGLTEGVVVTRPGVLPLQVALAEVVPVNARLWVLLDVKAGPWQKTAAVEEKP